MLHEHRVLTSTQITALAFPSPRAARQRLRELYCWAVLDRFQPFVSLGTAPMHYVLGPAGAAVLAAECGLDPPDLGYRHDRALGIAHSLRLAHTIGVNDWFTALVTTTRTSPDHRCVLRAWWSETRCARHFGDLVKPDAYGRWSAHGQHLEFFLEYDFGTETLDKLARKLPGYADLATATSITTPLLVWLPTSRRETTARRLLTTAWHHLDHPLTVPVATAAADLLNPHTNHASPAHPVWLPLQSPHGPTTRLALHHLPMAWPHLPPPTTESGQTSAAPATRPTAMPPPDPLPPRAPRRTAHPTATPRT